MPGRRGSSNGVSTCWSTTAFHWPVASTEIRTAPVTMEYPVSSLGQAAATTGPGGRGGGVDVIRIDPVVQVSRTRHWRAAGRMVNSGLWKGPEPLNVVTVS